MNKSCKLLMLLYTLLLLQKEITSARPQKPNEPGKNQSSDKKPENDSNHNLNEESDLDPGEKIEFEKEAKPQKRNDKESEVFLMPNLTQMQKPKNEENSVTPNQNQETFKLSLGKRSYPKDFSQLLDQGPEQRKPEFPENHLDFKANDSYLPEQIKRRPKQGFYQNDPIYNIIIDRPLKKKKSEEEEKKIFMPELFQNKPAMKRKENISEPKPNFDFSQLKKNESNDFRLGNRKKRVFFEDFDLNFKGKQKKSSNNLELGEYDRSKKYSKTKRKIKRNRKKYQKRLKLSKKEAIYLDFPYQYDKNFKCIPDLAKRISFLCSKMKNLFSIKKTPDKKNDSKFDEYKNLIEEKINSKFSEPIIKYRQILENKRKDFFPFLNEVEDENSFYDSKIHLIYQNKKSQRYFNNHLAKKLIDLEYELINNLIMRMNPEKYYPYYDMALSCHHIEISAASSNTPKKDYFILYYDKKERILKNFVLYHQWRVKDFMRNEELKTKGLFVGEKVEISKKIKIMEHLIKGLDSLKDDFHIKDVKPEEIFVYETNKNGVFDIPNEEEYEKMRFEGVDSFDGYDVFLKYYGVKFSNRIKLIPKDQAYKQLLENLSQKEEFEIEKDNRERDESNDSPENLEQKNKETEISNYQENIIQKKILSDPYYLTKRIKEKIFKQIEEMGNYTLDFNYIGLRNDSRRVKEKRGLESLILYIIDMIFGFQKNLENPYFYFKKIFKLYNISLKKNGLLTSSSNDFELKFLNMILLMDEKGKYDALTFEEISKITNFKDQILNMAYNISDSDKKMSSVMNSKIYLFMQIFTYYNTSTTVSCPNYFLRKIHFEKNSGFDNLNILNRDYNLHLLFMNIVKNVKRISDKKKYFASKLFRVLAFDANQNYEEEKSFDFLMKELKLNVSELREPIDHFRVLLMDFENIEKILLINNRIGTIIGTNIYKTLMENYNIDEMPYFPNFLMCVRNRDFYDANRKFCNNLKKRKDKLPIFFQLYEGEDILDHQVDKNEKWPFSCLNQETKFRITKRITPVFKWFSKPLLEYINFVDVKDENYFSEACKSESAEFWGKATDRLIEYFPRTFRNIHRSEFFIFSDIPFQSPDKFLDCFPVRNKESNKLMGNEELGNCEKEINQMINSWRLNKNQQIFKNNLIPIEESSLFEFDHADQKKNRLRVKAKLSRLLNLQKKNDIVRSIRPRFDLERQTQKKQSNLVNLKSAKKKDILKRVRRILLKAIYLRA